MSCGARLRGLGRGFELAWMLQMPRERGMLTGGKLEGRDLGTSLPLARDLSGFSKQETVGWSLEEIWVFQ